METVTAVDVEKAQDTSGLGGHPRGLMTLFFTEMWERFSYYGMRAILMLYMTKSAAEGGLNFGNAKGAAIYGMYTGAAYLLCVPGGWVADNLLGARTSVLYGGIIIALGHFSMAFPSQATFFLGLVLIAFGTGLLKPNISTMVGGLYGENDARRDGGFSIFYMGINLGAFLSPLVCGYLAQSDSFKVFLSNLGISPQSSWHWGFAAAGVGMTLGLVQYVLGSNRLRNVGLKSDKQAASEASGGAPQKAERAAQIAAHPKAKFLQTLSYIFWGVAIAVFALAAILAGLHLAGSAFGLELEDAFALVYLACISALLAMAVKYIAEVKAQGEDERATSEAKRMGVIAILFVFTILFWMAFEQAGSSLTLFADEMTRNNLLGYDFPSSWFQSVNSVFIILLAPVFSTIWIRRQNKFPSSPMKFALGLVFAGLGFVVVAYGASIATGNRLSPLWLIVVYLLHTIGELCLSPVGLSTITKLAPIKLVGLMMGVWFLATSIGNYLGGRVAGFFDSSAEGAVVKLFAYVALATIVAGGILAAISSPVRRMMGRIN